MTLLLDELWSPEIAEQLRGRRIDAIAIQEREHHDRYGNTDDEIVFELAQEDGRTIVTDNVHDYEAARVQWKAKHATPHHGVIYALNPPFNRHKGPRVVGPMVRALDYFVRQLAPQGEPLNRPHWLRAAPDDYS